jgi:hypothetical protein
VATHQTIKQVEIDINCFAVSTSFVALIFGTQLPFGKFKLEVVVVGEILGATTTSISQHPPRIINLEVVVLGEILG